MARRIASFDKQEVAETKALVDAASLPGDAELPPALTAFFASAGRPAAQARVAALAAHGYGQDGELERRLGALATLATTPPDRNPTPPPTPTDPPGAPSSASPGALGSVTRR
jgi:hypothetical protein